MDRNQGHEEGPRRFQTSFAGRVYLAFASVLALMAAIAAVCSAILVDPWLVFLIALLIGLPIGAVLVARILRPLDITLSGLRDGISSFRDRDFTLRLASDRNDEMGELARLYNDVGRLLLEERHNIRQKELLLEAALDRSPVPKRANSCLAAPNLKGVPSPRSNNAVPKTCARFWSARAEASSRSSGTRSSRRITCRSANFCSTGSATASC
jgi:hypothetical protein